MVYKKSLGYGSIALCTLICGNYFIWTVSPQVYEALGLNLYTNGSSGSYYPFLLSFMFWIPTIIISRRYPNDFGANISNRIGEMLLFINAVLIIAFLISYFTNGMLS